MRNIPCFATDLGVGSLVLDQIPYTDTAYVYIQDSADAERFVDECAQFCRAAGAEKVFAAGHDVLEAYPVQYEVFEMCRPLEGVEDTQASVLPVAEGTLGRWLDLYREKMNGVDGAVYMSDADGKRLLLEGSGYFVHQNGQLLGIGKASGENVDAIASAVPGAGKTVLLALCHCLSGPMVRLKVASTNCRAIGLYRSLDFICTSVYRRWYRIL